MIKREDKIIEIAFSSKINVSREVKIEIRLKEIDWQIKLYLHQLLIDLQLMHSFNHITNLFIANFTPLGSIGHSHHLIPQNSGVLSLGFFSPETEQKYRHLSRPSSTFAV